MVLGLGPIGSMAWASLSACSTRGTAAEVLALDILHDSGGQHITRPTVEHHLGRLAAHRSRCSCWRCEAAAKASIDRVYWCLPHWRRTTPTWS